MWPLMGPYLEPQVVEKPMLKRFYWHGFPSNAPAVNFLSAISKGILIFPFSQVQKDFIVTQNVKKDWIIFYNCFLNRQSGKDNNRNFLLLVWDEWASYILSLDKKVAEEEKKKLAILLMLGRSFNVHVFYVCNGLM